MLLVKLSSLGDVVHALPALTDAAKVHAGLEVHWVIEEGYQVIPALHPAVTRVIPIALRRWRHNLRDAGAELRDCVARLRMSSYELVLDAQGLLKSSLVARVCRGTRIGFDRASAREPLAAFGYRRGIAVPKRQHAIDRQRALFAAALEYPVPVDAIDYGIGARRAGSTPDVCGVVLAHGTTWDNKQWPEHFWAELADRALCAGERVTLPWGNADEWQRAQRIAALAPGADVSDRLVLRDVVELLAGSRAVVSVDSGIGHLSAALGVPTVALYGPTDAALTGCRGASVTNLSADFVCAPCLQRRCSYAGEVVEVDGARIEPPCFAQVTPERVWQQLRASMESR
jgi:lipopolysaccharide heptosyltransferase I